MVLHVSLNLELLRGITLSFKSLFGPFSNTFIHGWESQGTSQNDIVAMFFDFDNCWYIGT